MDIQLRPATEQDFPEIARIDSVAFGFTHSAESYADTFSNPPEILLAGDGERLVGVAAHYPFSMTVPGGGDLQVPGLTWVAVLPTHRRRGVLTALLGRLAEQYHAAGVPCAVLMASEGSIYRRFGYGVASTAVKVSIDRRLATLRAPVDAGAVEQLTAEQARQRLPELYRRWQQVTPGALNRTDRWWDRLFFDPESRRQGKSEKFYLVHPDGYLTYRTAERWTDGHPDSRCEILDYRPITRQAHAALWQVLLGMDLIPTIESWQVPSDDPLPFLLTDFRQLRTVASKDGLWLRPVNLAALLAGRRYAVDFEAVFEVAGERVALAGGPDGAECVPTDRPAQLWLDRPELGSIYLGGYRLHMLHRAGLVRSDSPGLLDRLDLAFGTDRAPRYGTNF
ncbi:MAG: GNAT family N-acetyltransferase [Jatrophihabitantaceae bacterium]